MSHNLFNTLQEFKMKSGQERQVLLAARSRKGPRRQGVAAAGVDTHRARIGAAQLRRQEGHRGARARARQLETQRAAHRGDPLRAFAHPAAGPDRHSGARRPRRDAQRRRPARQERQGGRAAGAGGSGGRPLDPDRPLRREERARSQHEARVQAQPGALHLHEMGDAGLRHLPRRSTRHRHRAPGEPRVSRRAACTRRTASTTRTRWSAPTATRP